MSDNTSISDQLSDGNSNTDTDTSPDLNNSSGNNQSSQNGSPLVLNDQLKGLIGEGKKYSTAQAAIDSVGHAQDHISKLEAELAEWKKTENVDDKPTGLSTEDLDAALKRIADSKGADAQLTAQDVSKQLEDALSTRDSAQAAQAAQVLAEGNQLKFTGHLNKQFGKEASSVYSKLIADSGLPEDKIEALVRDNPDFVIGLLPASETYAQNTQSSANTSAHQAQSTAAQWSDAWIRDVRRNDPNRYYGQDFQMDLLNPNNRK